MLDTEVDDVELSILIPVAVNGVMTRQYCVGDYVSQFIQGELQITHINFELREEKARGDITR